MPFKTTPLATHVVYWERNDSVHYDTNQISTAKCLVPTETFFGGNRNGNHHLRYCWIEYKCHIVIIIAIWNIINYTAKI